MRKKKYTKGNGEGYLQMMHLWRVHYSEPNLVVTGHASLLIHIFMEDTYAFMISKHTHICIIDTQYMDLQSLTALGNSFIYILETAA